MTDEAYDAQTLATSARIERLHRLRFGPQARTWLCEHGHVNRDSKSIFCEKWQIDAKRGGAAIFGAVRHGNEPTRYRYYGIADDPEELIYSRAN